MVASGTFGLVTGLVWGYAAGVGRGEKNVLRALGVTGNPTTGVEDEDVRRVVDPDSATD